MNDNVRDYARLGLVHHMLYPDCMNDPDDHVRTLAQFVKRDDMETFDCCLPYGDDRRAQLIPLIRDCDKEDVTFAIHLFPLRKFPPSSPGPHEQAQIRMIITDMIEQAAAIGATGFIFGTGGPSPTQATDAEWATFADFCRWLCGELAPHGITALLEPFDTDIDKKFLYGPSKTCVEFIQSLGFDNFGIELDVAHIPLMGETFQHAIQTCAPLLRRVHLGNCVLKDKSHPRYGDTHPPIGFEGGEIDVPELTIILRSLLEVGFLDKQNRRGLLLEMTPWPGKTLEETIRLGYESLEQAWHAV